MKSATPAQARWAVAASFLLMGLLIGAWVPHVPLAKERLDVGPGIFGLALLAIAGGAVCAMPIAGVLINRLGSAAMTTITGVLFCAAFFGPVLAPTLPAFIVCAALMGMTIGSMDVAMNAHGIAVEKAMGRPVMSSLHAIYSVGAMAGAFLGAALLEGFGELTQAVVMALICLVLQLGAARFFLPGSVDKGLSGSHFAWPTKATIGLGMLCYLALLIEGSILDWGAILLRQSFAVDAGIAALGFALYQAGMALSRFSGDIVRMKVGAARMVFVSALLTAVGTTLALVAPSPALAIGAFVLAGIGVGNIAPVLFAGGGRIEPTAPGRGIAAVTTLGYSGFLSGPPLIGFVAQVTNLTAALFLTVAAALIIAIFARSAKAADSF